MAQGQLITVPKEYLLVDLIPTFMPMPGTGSRIPLDDSESSQNFLRHLRSGKYPYIFGVMSNPKIKEAPERFYKIGVIAKAEAHPTETRISLGGSHRAGMLNLKRVEDRDWFATIGKVEDENHDDYFIDSHSKIMADVIRIKDLLISFTMRVKRVYEAFDDGVLLRIVNGFENTDWEDKDAVDNFIWNTVHFVPDLFQSDKQPFLESTSLPERIGMCIKMLNGRIKLLEDQRASLGNGKSKSNKGRSVTVKGPDSGQNEDDFVKDAHEDIKQQWEKFKEVRDYMNEGAKKVALEDIKALLSYGSPQGNSYEWTKVMPHLEFLLGLPWKEETVQESDISKVAQILDEDHYGLNFVKDAICDHLAPKFLNPEGKGHILCFVGPPGVGKTSLAKSIARALNRKYIRLSLGGVEDEHQIRGHRRTYIGSDAGEILKEMKRCGVRNPIFVTDEIDKLGQRSSGGGPASAMLEVFDPEQNNSFRDHYLACGFDLSRVMFISTANVEENITLPLRDRMDIIRLPGYLEVEKVEIAKRYLVNRWMKETGLAKNNIEVQWAEDVMEYLIRGYTSEAGVRNLERSIATILRKIARAYLKSITEEKPEVKFVITRDSISEYLGPAKFFKERAIPTVVGEAIGLAWTPVGGGILYVQAEFYDRLDGKKTLDLTGMQGEVMKESAKLAVTRLRNILRERDPESADKLQNNAIHLHIPEGAVHKDGPSAGITILSAFYSEATGKLAKENLAMTGEIDNKGRVLPVGGIREKIVAAERAGIEEIIMPKDNERNLHDVPKEVKDKLRFHFVESVTQVLEIAFPDPR